MISSFITNLSLFISFSFMWHQFCKNQSFFPSSASLVRVLDGVAAGILAIFLVYHTPLYTEPLFLDLRHIPVIATVLYCGFLPAVISSLVLSAALLIVNFNFASILSFFMMLVIATGCGLITRREYSNAWRKWAILLAYSQFIYLIGLSIVNPPADLYLSTIIYHLLSTVLAGFLTFYLMGYIHINTKQYRQYKEYAERDPLTGLFNVRSFQHFYKRMIHTSSLMNQCCAFCLIDIDFFKKINDTYGHTAGDEVLKQFAKLVQCTVRKNDRLSRNGGEEFSVLLPDTEMAQAEEVAHRIREAVAGHAFVLPNEQEIHLSVSIGLSVYNGAADEQVLLFENADTALYQAKLEGRNQVRSYKSVSK